MTVAIADPRVPLVYLPRFREYGLRVAGTSAIDEIHFCPFCGMRLPGSLRDAFFDELEALDLEPEDPALPDRFHSDAWWKASESAT